MGLDVYTRGKHISLAALPGPPRVPSPNLGPVIPPMKTYILLCGENRPPHINQEAPLGGGGLAQTRGPLPPCRETTAPDSSPASPLCLQGAPEAKGGPAKTVSSRSSAWGTVIVSLKALSSCVCAQADYNWKSLAKGGEGWQPTLQSSADAVPRVHSLFPSQEVFCA